MLAGGTDAPINETGVGAFDAMRALSTRNDAPQQASRPFDAGRDGFVIAEGAGDPRARRFRARPRARRPHYAEIVGYGMSSEAFHVAAARRERRVAGARHAGGPARSGLDA